MKPLEELVRPNIRALKPYSTARDEFSGGEITTWLDANENPYDNGVNRYPDPHQKLLKQKIAALKGVREEQVFIGNGSDEAIDLCYRIFCRPGVDNAVSIAPTYGMYRVAADINDVEMREVAPQLAACPAIERVYPSDANFILVRTPDPDRMYDALISAGVIVRNRSRIPGCEGCLRITVGTPAENARMIETVKNFRL